VDQVAAVLGPGGTLEGELISYERRPGQLAMGRRVAEAIEADERLLVEAGTGTGKTLAYLVPAILSGRKVVVATGTKTLQDQIARLDLPRLGAVLDRPFSFAVMKGLGNYVCRRASPSTRASRTWAWTAATTSWPAWRRSSRSRPAATGPR
jgi:ATP-dependent DNA helicase DinG